MPEDLSQKTPASRLFVLIVFILIVGALGFLGGYYLTGKNIQEANLSVTNVSVSASPSTTPSINVANWQTYTNTKYEYLILYPDNYTFREYKDGLGVAFRPSNLPNDPAYEMISISSNNMPQSATGMSLSEYSKIAATQEIQNYQSLNTSNKITTDSGVVGYETTWNVTGLNGGSSSISLPITYFSDSNATYLYQIMVNEDKYLDVYNQMIKTFSLLGNN